jgi:hypothetical protein
MAFIGFSNQKKPVALTLVGEIPPMLPLSANSKGCNPFEIPGRKKKKPAPFQERALKP